VKHPALVVFTAAACCALSRCPILAQQDGTEVLSHRGHAGPGAAAVEQGFSQSPVEPQSRPSAVEQGFSQSPVEPQSRPFAAEQGFSRSPVEPQSRPFAVEQGFSPARQPLPAARVAEHLASFDQIWTTVRDRHWDPALHGVDWERAKRELRPRVEAASSDKEARAVMLELVDRLGQTHFNVIPADLYGLLGDGSASAPGDSGIRARVLERRAIVTSVIDRSPGARLGVRPGWEILRIGDFEVRPRLDRLVTELPDTLLKEADLAAAVEGRLKGQVGETVRLECDPGDGRVLQVSVPFELPAGVRTVVGNLPPVWVRVEARELEDGVGYFALSSFVNPVYVMDEFGKAIERARNAPGLIVDLRGNEGGAMNIVMGLLGWLVPERDRHVGTVVQRSLTLRIVVQPRPAPFGGRVAVLVDGLSMSGSEVLAAALQDTGRARLFGSRTAGAVLGAMVERLPNGDRFQYAFADYVSVTGRRLEGYGVIPDVGVQLTRDALVKGRDPVIDAAVAWIREGR
jgi:carboxyl-terminal processing protease